MQRTNQSITRIIFLTLAALAAIAGWVAGAYAVARW